MIEDRYLLALNVQCYRDPAGKHWFDPLWERDLRAHLGYIKHLTVATPCASVERTSGPLRALSGTQPEFRDLPAPTSMGEALRSLPSTIVRLWAAVGETDIVHTGVAGWPIPMGWLAVPMARLRSRKIVIVVESAPWRLIPGLPASWKQRLRAAIAESMARWCLRGIDLAIVTQSGYRDLAPLAHVVPASWIGESELLSPGQSLAAWDAKPTNGVRLVFAGRLEPQKGVGVILESLPALAERKTRIQLVFVGEGSMREAVLQAAREHPELVQWRPPLAYGPEFLSLLGEHHAVLVPSLSDEQPRIVFDAYSRALPVLASDTPGLREVVVDGASGVFVRSGDVAGWRELLVSLDGERLRQMGLRAVELARSRTHEQMHRRREGLLGELRGNR